MFAVEQLFDALRFEWEVDTNWFCEFLSFYGDYDGLTMFAKSLNVVFIMRGVGCGLIIFNFQFSFF